MVVHRVCSSSEDMGSDPGHGGLPLYELLTLILAQNKFKIINFK